MTDMVESQPSKTVIQPVNPTIGIFYAQLGGLLKAGMPLPKALRTLASDSGTRAFRDALERAAKAIDDGKDPQLAFADEEAQLGGMLGRVAGAAAASGRLAQLLSELSAWTLTQDRIQRRIVDALSYPLTVLLLASLLTLILMTLASSDAFVDDMISGDVWAEGSSIVRDSRIYRSIAMYVSGGVFVITALMPFLTLLARFSQGARKFRETLCIRLPVVGAIYRPLALSRLCGSISVLMKAGIPYHQALSVGGELSGFRPYLIAAREGAQILESGGKQSDAFSDRMLFPASLRFILGSAESRGDTPEAFAELAQLYQIEAEGRGRIVALLAPPLCLLLVGVIIAMIIFAMLSPLIRALEMIGG